MYRWEGVGQCPIPTAPRKDPCEAKYTVDMPIIGEETVGVPISLMTEDALTSLEKQLPAHLPNVYAQLNPYLERAKREAFNDTEKFIDRTVSKVLERQIRPEVEAQKAVAFAEVEGIVNRALVTTALIGFAVVGGVAATVWWSKR